MNENSDVLQLLINVDQKSYILLKKISKILKEKLLGKKMARKRRAVIKQPRTDQKNETSSTFFTKSTFNQTNILIFIVILVLQLQNVFGKFVFYLKFCCLKEI